MGFKYIGELIKQDKILIGGEESAGLSIRKHVPEKDGVLAGLLCCEMVARRGGSLGTQLQQIFAEVGSYYPLRENFHLTPEVKQKFTEKLRSDPSEFHGIKVAKVVRTDGLKLVPLPMDRGSATGSRARSRWCARIARRAAGKALRSSDRRRKHRSSIRKIVESEHPSGREESLRAVISNGQVSGYVSGYPLKLYSRLERPGAES